MRVQTPSSQRPARLLQLLTVCLAAFWVASCAGRDARETEPAPPQGGQAAVVVEANSAGAPASLNENFESEDLDVADFLNRFEGESREVYAQREEVVSALDLQPGEAIADIGSGTGLFSILFAHEVGPKGKVYGVDIAPRFIELLGERAFTLGLDQIEPVLCTDRSTNLEAGSVDAVFTCDTYHHFEYPLDTLASIHAALKPGGRLMIVDFHRIPGVSRPWLVQHVRCGKQQVIAEVEAAGFRRLADPPVPGLDENYVLLFERP